MGHGPRYFLFLSIVLNMSDVSKSLPPVPSATLGGALSQPTQALTQTVGLRGTIDVTVSAGVAPDAIVQPLRSMDGFFKAASLYSQVEVKNIVVHAPRPPKTDLDLVFAIGPTNYNESRKPSADDIWIVPNSKPVFWRSSVTAQPDTPVTVEWPPFAISKSIWANFEGINQPALLIGFRTPFKDAAVAAGEYKFLIELDCEVTGRGFPF